jgi:type IV secretory pathway VirB3-like protein
MRKRKIRVSAILGAAVTACGIIGGPAGTAIIGAKASAIVSLVGVVIQAVTKPAVRRDSERQP